MSEATEYTFHGHIETFYPACQHPDPETDGVLHVRPGDVVDFAGELPPLDGLWRDADGIVMVAALAPEVSEDTDGTHPEDSEDGAGTGASGDGEGPQEE